MCNSSSFLGTKASIEALVALLNTATVPANVEVVVCPMALHVPYAVASLKPEIQVADNPSIAIGLKYTESSREGE